MERITKGMVERQKDILAGLLNHPTKVWETKADGQSVSVVGAWFVEHAYSGYRLVEIANEHGGERHPFGNTLMSLRELYNLLYAIREGIYNGAIAKAVA